MGYKKITENFLPINLEEMRQEGFLKENNGFFEEHHLKINSKNGWKEITRCPLCESEEKITEFSKFGVKIVGCKKCNLRYAGKIPANLSDVYDGKSYLSESVDTYAKNIEYRKERFGKERVKLIKSFLKKENAKLLDVGCGIGWFLEVAKVNGFEIFGQEFGKELANWTSKRLGIKIWSQPIEELNAEIKFDVITLFDVIEHVENPLQFLKSCKRLLTDEGIIVVFTPNFDSLAIQIMKEHSNLIGPSAHLVYFNEESIKTLAEKVNMDILYCKTHGIDLGDLKSYYEWLGENELSKSCVKLYPLLQPAVDAAGAGNHFRFIFKNTKNDKLLK